MNEDSSQEVLIVRNTCVNSLYDVIRVDFFNEDVEYLFKGLSFHVAVGIVEEIESK